ncbi:UDP-galactose transporter like protein 1 [Astathelohania contejeani]|uniref:UDP-galactose transporter homolog 1 n=1 Tax=Astathelohania contejeani TaxID=164912 RepID=A0ABQ7HVL7_9MICR|nr:UDP-galactose transporter like protein 1 [Thelohania contejeani]
MDKGLLIHAIGIYIFFLSWGIFQERITTTMYNGSKFNYFIFLSTVQSIGAITISYLASRRKGVSLNYYSKGLIFKYIQCSLLQLLSSQLSYRSLRYINYPTLIIGKSCKLIPVVLMNLILNKTKFDRKKYISIVLTSIGMFFFMFFGDSKKNTSSNGNIIGILLLLSNLFIDGIISSIQDKIFKIYNIDSLHMMFYANVFTLINSMVIMLSPNNPQFLNAILFIKYNPSILFDLIFYSFSNVIGQLFVYSMLGSYGSVALTTVNVTRKLFSILISLIFFGHSVNFIQWISVLIVFLSLGLELTGKRKGKTA